MQRQKYRILHCELVENKNVSSCLLSSNLYFILRMPNSFDILYCRDLSIQSSFYFRTIVADNKSLWPAFNFKSIQKCISDYYEITAHHVDPAKSDLKRFFCADRIRWHNQKHYQLSNSLILKYVRLIMTCLHIQPQHSKALYILFVILQILTQYVGSMQGLLMSKSPELSFHWTPSDFENSSNVSFYNNTNSTESSVNYRLLENSSDLEHDQYNKMYRSSGKSYVIMASTIGKSSVGVYPHKLDKLERNLAAVLIKVAYGTTSTTKRSIPDISHVPSLTTIATPLLATLSMNHRSYELDLERDHALPTSAPNADILKSNSNPIYPNPNRFYHERNTYKFLTNSTPKPSLSNDMKKSNGKIPTISLFSGSDMRSNSSSARAFFTPPLPSEYQHAFANKPTLRGTNNEATVEYNSGNYINRKPIPPPSLMPGHERIPIKPPDLLGTLNNNDSSGDFPLVIIPSLSGNTTSSVYLLTTVSVHHDINIKKALSPPSKIEYVGSESISNAERINTLLPGRGYFDSRKKMYKNSYDPEVRREILSGVKRILNGSNGRKSDVPDVLLNKVTVRPNKLYSPSSPAIFINSSLMASNKEYESNTYNKQNINKNKKNSEISDMGSLDKQQMTKIDTSPLFKSNLALSNLTSTPSAAAAIFSNKSKPILVGIVTSATTSSYNLNMLSSSKNEVDSSSTLFLPSSTSSSILVSASAFPTWSLAWNVHVYMSVVLFTILAIYSFYKMMTYNKLSQLFPQYYFIFIHLILVVICTLRIFYLCYDAYNIHSSFHIFVSETLLNLPAAFLTVAFVVLILFLSQKSLNPKNNRYSTLIRPIAAIMGCSVHIVLCITLHYVESYTFENHQQQQQQQQFLTERLQIQQQQQLEHNNDYIPNGYSYAANIAQKTTLNSSMISMQDADFIYHNSAANMSSIPTPPPRVLSLICQLIHIFLYICLGILYLYLHRTLKHILRSKSQNYIHGYQNLSYAIHITIATALLFVLLASFQIFGAIRILPLRPLGTPKTADNDWLQWSYQFSMRLIEITIISLISWVTGLKTSNISNTVSINLTNSEARVPGRVIDSNLMFNTNLSVNLLRGRHNFHSQHNHTNMTNLFLPCTSSTSREQLNSHCPTVCNPNSNLHTYTMRTGKLMYDNSFAFNSLNANNPATICDDFYHPYVLYNHPRQHSKASYHHSYDLQSLHNETDHNESEHASHSNFRPENHLQYLTSDTTRHYENPNFDLKGSATSGSVLAVSSNTGNGTIELFSKNAIPNSATPALSINSHMDSNSSSSSLTTLQQQMLLLQGGGNACYPEHIHENYNFNNFENPKPVQQLSLNDRTEKCDYKIPEKQSSNSNHSCRLINVADISGIHDGDASAILNKPERDLFTSVRETDAINNIASNSLTLIHDINTVGRNHLMPILDLQSNNSSKHLTNIAVKDVFSSSTTKRLDNIQKHRPNQTSPIQSQPQYQYSIDNSDNNDDNIMLPEPPHKDVIVH